MRLDKWLIVTNTGATRVTANKPDLKWNEIAVHLLVELPNALFDRPHVEARVTVPPEAAPPPTITAQVLEDAREAIQQATSMHVTLSVAEPVE